MSPHMNEKEAENVMKISIIATLLCLACIKKKISYKNYVVTIKKYKYQQQLKLILVPFPF